MENDWISLLERMEEIKENSYLTLKIYSDESGAIEDNDEEIIDFSSFEDLEAQVEELEHDNKYKKFYDILETFSGQDFFNIYSRFENIRRKVMNDNKR